MARLVAMMGALLVITVGRSDGTVTLPFTEREYATGRDPKVACSVTGETFVSWLTPSGQTITTSSTTGRITVTVTGDTYTLNIDSVTAQDGGEYRCQGSLNSGVFTLNVNYDVQDAVTLKQTLRMDQLGTLVLDVSGYPQLTYEWTKDGQKVTFGGRITLNPQTGSITFNPVRMIDEGNYTCEVISTKLGGHTFDPISARVIDNPQINKYEGEPVNRRLTKGYNNTFHCDIKKGTPKPTVTWYFGWDDTLKKVDSQYDSRYSHPTEEEWTITGVTLADKDKYRCIATNEAGKDSLRFEITQVDVPPLIDPVLTDVTVDEGVKQDLVCKVSGSPQPMVEWLKEDVPYRPQTRTTEGNKVVKTISFTNIRRVDGGRYTCKANNGALDSNGKEIIVTQTINLNVNSPPMIDTRLSPTPVYSFIGYQKEVTVACSFSGYPTPLVKMVNSSGQEVAQGNSSASFKITTDSDNDFGTFNCTAENSLGMQHFLVELKVAEFPSGPRNLAAPKTCKSITLKWEAPESNGGLEILRYNVRLRKGDEDVRIQSVEASQREVKIDYPFEPDTAYEVYLTAQNDKGYGKEEMLGVTTKKFCLPSRPAITNTEFEVETSFTLTWQAPSDNGGDSNLKYKVEWRKKPVTEDTVAKEEDNIGDLSLKIEGLEGPAEYEFKVFAKNSEGDSEPDTRTFIVKQAPITPKVGARTQSGLGAGAIAGIVIAVILIVLITIDLFCCFFNSCGIIFCCHQAICGGGAKKDTYKDGKATEMEKKPLPENV
ncbi:unnamed protein product [Porites evermanni]|uniref:Uncharacterized protein n=1 Tax=Porites evermanni TaxID=104178 RepID=A0ABN8QEW7_9CNID|nr:unnamed protein product [Porites evermanni]